MSYIIQIYKIFHCGFEVQYFEEDILYFRTQKVLHASDLIMKAHGGRQLSNCINLIIRWGQLRWSPSVQLRPLFRRTGWKAHGYCKHEVLLTCHSFCTSVWHGHRPAKWLFTRNLSHSLIIYSKL